LLCIIILAKIDVSTGGFSLVFECVFGWFLVFKVWKMPVVFGGGNCDFAGVKVQNFQ